MEDKKASATVSRHSHQRKPFATSLLSFIHHLSSLQYLFIVSPCAEPARNTVAILATPCISQFWSPLHQAPRTTNSSVLQQCLVRTVITRTPGLRTLRPLLPLTILHCRLFTCLKQCLQSLNRAWLCLINLFIQATSAVSPGMAKHL